jgi:hypothetical protein
MLAAAAKGTAAGLLPALVARETVSAAGAAGVAALGAQGINRVAPVLAGNNPRTPVLPAGLSLPGSRPGQTSVNIPVAQKGQGAEAEQVGTDVALEAAVKADLANRSLGQFLEANNVSGRAAKNAAALTRPLGRDSSQGGGVFSRVLPAFLLQEIGSKVTLKTGHGGMPWDHSKPNGNGAPAVKPGVKEPTQDAGSGTVHGTPARNLAPAPSDVQAPAKPVALQLADGIVAQAEVLTRPGCTEFRIQLDPPELGRVQVHLVATDQGMSARLVVQNEAARQMMEKQLPGLRLSLAQAGVTLGHLDVRRDGGHSHEPGRQPGTPLPPQEIETSNRLQAAPQWSEVPALAAGRIDVVV